MKSRSSDYYIAQFWLDMLFDTNYGDKSGDMQKHVCAHLCGTTRFPGL